LGLSQLQSALAAAAADPANGNHVHIQQLLDALETAALAQSGSGMGRTFGISAQFQDVSKA
jgi:hypothetical protein